jgi:hypothetical protein
MKIDPSHLTLTCLATLALGAASARATVTFQNGYSGTVVEVSSATELAYQADVSASDLLHGLSPTVSSGGWDNTTNGANLSYLNDGAHGGNFSSVGNVTEGAWPREAGATATYVLGTGANGLGYDLTSILSVAAWQGSDFGNQAWDIEVRTVGGSFVTLALIDYQPLNGGAGAPGAGATKVTLSGLDATGIDAIRITSTDTSANGFIWRELDVFGTSTIPEPSSMASLAVCGLGLLCRRRRQ